MDQLMFDYASKEYVQAREAEIRSAAADMAAAAAAGVLPAVSGSDNGKFLRVVEGSWAAVTVPAAESNEFGGGS